MSVVIAYVLQCLYVCSHYFCSSVLVYLWSLLMFFSVGMSVVITYVLQCWYVCSHYLCSSVLVCLVITFVLQGWYVSGHYLCSSVLVCLWSLLMFFIVGMSVVITFVLQCWYVCGHYLLFFFSADWFEGPLAQIQVKFPWQLILMIQLTPYSLNPCLVQPGTINSS